MLGCIRIKIYLPYTSGLRRMRRTSARQGGACGESFRGRAALDLRDEACFFSCVVTTKFVLLVSFDVALDCVVCFFRSKFLLSVVVYKGGRRGTNSTTRDSQRKTIYQQLRTH